MFSLTIVEQKQMAVKKERQGVRPREDVGLWKFRISCNNLAMKNNGNKNLLKKMLFLGTIVFLSWPKAAQAYLDPGSGSYLIQVIIATATGGFFLFRGYWKKITELFRKRKSDAPKK